MEKYCECEPMKIICLQCFVIKVSIHSEKWMIECNNKDWCCHDTVHMLLTKLGYDWDDIIAPKLHHDFNDICSLIEERDHILKLELIFGKNLACHSLLIVGKYVMQSYYMTYPLVVEPLTPSFLQALKDCNWYIITSTNHDLNCKPRLTIYH